MKLKKGMLIKEEEIGGKRKFISKIISTKKTPEFHTIHTITILNYDNYSWEEADDLAEQEAYIDEKKETSLYGNVQYKITIIEEKDVVTLMI
jgi:hypothetical protein